MELRDALAFGICLKERLCIFLREMSNAERGSTPPYDTCLLPPASYHHLPEDSPSILPPACRGPYADSNRRLLFVLRHSHPVS